MKLLSMQFGRYYGRERHKMAAGGFEIAALSATGRPEDVLLHTHPEAHIIFVTRGIYQSEARPAARLESPVVVFNPPGVMHRDCFADVGGEFLAISISQPVLNAVLDGLALRSDPTAEDAVFTLQIGRALRRVCAARDSDSSLDMESLCLQLLGRFSSARGGEDRATAQRMKTARELLRDRCTEPLSVAHISRELGVHRVYFARAFRRAFGCSPSEYLRRCRVEKAAALLRNRRLSLIEVALASGFADQSHFCRTFRELCDVSPGEFRRWV